MSRDGDNSAQPAYRFLDKFIHFLGDGAGLCVAREISPAAKVSIVYTPEPLQVCGVVVKSRLPVPLGARSMS